MARLQELEVVEVSFVDLPANKRKFLLTKSHGGDPVEELLTLILETDLENESEIDQALADANLDEKSQEALKGAIKLLNAHRENVTPEVVKSLLTKAGFIDAPKPEPKSEVLLKEDGTLNLDNVPEQLRPALQALWDKGHASEEERAELEKTLKAERFEARKSEVLKKAADLKLPGASTEELADALIKAEDAAPAALQILDKVLAAASALIQKSELLEETGKSGDGEQGSAYDRAVAKARVLMEKDPTMTLGAAVDVVFKADRELAEEHSKETR